MEKQKTVLPESLASTAIYRSKPLTVKQLSVSCFILYLSIIDSLVLIASGLGARLFVDYIQFLKQFKGYNFEKIDILQS